MSLRAFNLSDIRTDHNGDKLILPLYIFLWSTSSHDLLNYQLAFDFEFLINILR